MATGEAGEAVSEERCQKCARPYAPNYASWQLSDTTCGMSPSWNEDGEEHDDCINECLYATVKRLETEVAAWRALAESRAVLHRGSETGEYFFEAFGKVVTIDSFESPGEAAVQSARQLKLIPEAK